MSEQNVPDFQVIRDQLDKLTEAHDNLLGREFPSRLGVMKGGAGAFLIAQDSGRQMPFWEANYSDSRRGCLLTGG
jgi:hypothetical protein